MLNSSMLLVWRDEKWRKHGRIFGNQEKLQIIYLIRILIRNRRKILRKD